MHQKDSRWAGGLLCLSHLTARLLSKVKHVKGQMRQRLGQEIKPAGPFVGVQCRYQTGAGRATSAWCVIWSLFTQLAHFKAALVYVTDNVVVSVS